ncbi:MAG TPA: PAS domain-containing protein, partial [Tissierellaceae bacterium]|nr:PAS domain-containing protein [Tissierellaceae bacterium]
MEILGKGIKKMREKYKKKKELHPQSKPSYFTLKENLIYSQNLLKAGSWIYSLSDEKVFWTNEIYNILECRPEELDNVLEAFYDYIHPDDTREVKEAVKRALQGKEYEIEYRIVTPKGRHKFLLEKIRVIKDSRGEIEKIAGIIKDITESKIIENNNYILGKHINYLRNMSGVGSWKYDYTKGQIYWSEEVYDIYEIGVEELGNKVCNLKKLIHPEDLIILEKKFNEGLEGRVIDLEHKIILKNGKEKYLLIKGEPIFNKFADVVGLVGVVWDVTKIKNSQQKLDEVEREKGRAQKQFRALVQNSSDIFAIIKPDGMIKYISPAVKEILGYRPEELTGKFIFNSYDKEGVKRAKEMLEKIVHIHKGTIKRDMKCRTKSGDRVYTELIMSNYLDEPFINGIVVNIRDISRRIETEQKLKHLSNHDSLTQLPNRLYFNKKLADSCKMAAKTSTGFTLIMLDIDGFKHVNNALGYKLGDHLIIQVVKRLRKYLGNKFMARYLGDQFAIIIDKLDNRTH